MAWFKTLLLSIVMLGSLCVRSQSNALVFQSDFGMKDGAVSAMKGVAFGVSSNLKMFDLTHEIPAYNIWDAAYRLKQTAPYWPAGTVFVSVVDPGVGSERKSVVLKTRSGHYFVTPDNGTLTFVAEVLGIEEVREIDETVNRLTNSGKSYTFHGRDVYAYTGARLASGVIGMEKVGRLLKPEIIKLPYQKAVLNGKIVQGNIDALDIQYGNVWTNIDSDLLAKINVQYGDKVHVEIFNMDRLIYQGDALYGATFSVVDEGENVAYLNSLLTFSLAINQGNFAEQFKIGYGSGWRLILTKLK